MMTYDDMRGCIQEWFAQTLSVVDVAETYATIMSESARQLEYMAGEYRHKEDDYGKES